MVKVSNGRQLIIPADRWDAFKLSFTTLDLRTVSFINWMNRLSKFKAAIIPVIIWLGVFFIITHLPLESQFLEKPLLIVLLLIASFTVIVIGGKFMSWVTVKLHHASHKNFLLPTFYFWVLSLIFGVLLTGLTFMAVLFGGITLIMLLIILFVIAASRPRYYVIR